MNKEKILENPYIAEDLYWFVCDDEDRVRDYQEKAFTNGGMSIAEYVRDYCFEDFVKCLKRRGYDLAQLPSGGSEARSSEPEDFIRKD